MKKLWKVPVLALLVALLVLVRQFEKEYFYDPFMAFFEGGAPEFHRVRWYLNIAWRFLLNSVISIAVLYVVFQKGEVAKFAAFLYFGLFLVLFPLFIFLMPNADPEDYLSLFYVRRFLVHPLLLLILLPAFYYHYLGEGKSKTKGSAGNTISKESKGFPSREDA